MTGGNDFSARMAIALAAALVCAGAFATAAPAKKKGASATTASASVPLASSQTQTAFASCKGGSHATGGGFAVSPLYNPAGGVGTRTRNQVSTPSGKKGWTAVGSAESAPLSTGTFTAYARCEKNSLGKVAGSVGGTATIAPKGSQTTVASCPPRTHALSGGYETGVPFAAANPTSSELVVVQSQRTGQRDWSFSAYNQSATLGTTLVVHVTCELNKGARVSTHSTTVAVGNDSRSTTEATCTKKEHAVSGGFLVTPLPVAGGVVPVIGVDESLPTKKGWRIGIYEAPTFNLPAGSTLTTQVNCKKN